MQDFDEKIRNDKENKAALLLVEILMGIDPPRNSDLGIALNILVRCIQDYEKKRFPRTPPEPLKKEKNIRIKVEETGYVWDRNKLRRLAQIVKRNEDEASRREKTARLKLVITNYVERDDVMGLAEFFRAYIEDEVLEKAKTDNLKIAVRVIMANIFPKEKRIRGGELRQHQHLGWNLCLREINENLKNYLNR